MKVFVRVAIGTMAAMAAMAALTGVASAHVTVQPPSAPQGSFTKLSFRVPNEEAAADTTELQVQFPPDHPIASVSVQPKEGWTYKVTTATLPQPIKTDDGEVSEAVTEIAWTGGTIKPGEFDEFSVSAGPLPTDVTSLEFKAVQTYSDGTVVRWIDEQTPGGAEPEHPAPVLTLTAAGGDAAPAATPASGSDRDSTARTLGIIGIVVGVVGVVIGAIGFRRGRRRPAES